MFWQLHLNLRNAAQIPSFLCHIHDILSQCRSKATWRVIYRTEGSGRNGRAPRRFLRLWCLPAALIWPSSNPLFIFCFLLCIRMEGWEYHLKFRCSRERSPYKLLLVLSSTDAEICHFFFWIPSGWLIIIQLRLLPHFFFPPPCRLVPYPSRIYALFLTNFLATGHGVPVWS